jgi:hypothetical protein
LSADPFFVSRDGIFGRARDQLRFRRRLPPLSLVDPLFKEAFPFFDEIAVAVDDSVKELFHFLVATDVLDVLLAGLNGLGSIVNDADEIVFFVLKRFFSLHLVPPSLPAIMPEGHLSLPGCYLTAFYYRQKITSRGSFTGEWYRQVTPEIIVRARLMTWLS